MFADINLTHLRYFYDAVLLKSISAAARENFVSQSAISQGIVKLEHSLQVILTTHQRQNFKLTEEGQTVFDEAKRIFASVDALKERLSSMKGEISGDVNFACTNALAQYFLPSKYLLMREQYPKVRVKFHRGSLQFIHEALKQEKVSFALTLDAPEFYGYDKEILSKGCFRLYQAKGAKKTPGIFVDHEENAEVILLKKQYKERYGEELIIQDALSGWGLIAAFVQMGCGSGFLPEFILKDKKDVKEVKWDTPPIKYTIVVLKLKGTVLSRAVKAFLEILKD